jgi:hypothetical protein
MGDSAGMSFLIVITGSLTSRGLYRLAQWIPDFCFGDADSTGQSLAPFRRQPSAD